MHQISIYEISIHQISIHQISGHFLSKALKHGKEKQDAKVNPGYLGMLLKRNPSNSMRSKGNICGDRHEDRNHQ